MKLTFLGTAAANAFPEAFCSCSNCEQARALGGHSLRKRSSALINTDLLIDLGPDIMSAAIQHNCPLTQVRYCLQTHAHADHLDTSHMLSRSPGFGVVGAPRLHFYASEGSIRQLERWLERDCAPYGLLASETEELLNLQIHTVRALQPFQVGGYRVIALPANHDPVVEPLLYAIQAEGRTILYATDTAIFPEETWQAFHQFKLKFDFVILDHTYGPEEPGSDHLSAHQVSEHIARMRAEGLLTEGARAFATHIAHEGNPPHPELADFAAQHGYEVAYDGLTVQV
jgi:phosphoribosyl 1,2-cyclic phosphate phosphodiesterase